MWGHYCGLLLRECENHFLLLHTLHNWIFDFAAWNVSAIFHDTVSSKQGVDHELNRVIKNEEKFLKNLKKYKKLKKILKMQKFLKNLKFFK